MPFFVVNIHKRLISAICFPLQVTDEKEKLAIKLPQIKVLLLQMPWRLQTKTMKAAQV